MSVHNEGAPIPPEAQETLFDPFMRAAGEHRAQGWGLGLMLVRACAEAHGGSVHVDSAPGRGTTFTMRLPVDARPAQGWT
jgi:signal transduction histidine kinase